MKSFEEFIRSGIVKKQTPNMHRALSIVKEAEAKRDFLETSLKNIPQEKMNFNFIVDSCYDILIEGIRAKMLIDGYNSGSSHEAEVSYLRTLGFLESDVRFMDELRYYRNGTKYYGTVLTKEYGDKVLEFMKKLYPKLRGLIK
ncbi:MAG TPA: hypothetical protein VJA47_00125 [archaeon]|nr:hypothetical protein [archaeon]